MSTVGQKKIQPQKHMIRFFPVEETAHKWIKWLIKKLVQLNLKSGVKKKW